jgi:F-type H+-transporting ATPase subunit b
MSAKFIIGLIALSGDGNGGLLDVSPGLIFWTVVTFIILLVILRKLAWKPILKSLSDRETLIKDSLEKAEIAKQEAEKLIEENKANLDKAEEEAQKIIAQSREYAEKLKTQMLEESNAEAKKRLEEAKVEIDRKSQEAFNQMKEQIASIAVEAAEKIIRENLDEKKQKNLVNKYLDDLSKN